LQIGPPPLRTFAAYTLATPLGFAGARERIAMVFAPDPAPRDFATRGGGMLSLRPSAFIGASQDLAAARDGIAALHARYGELTLPVSVLFGTEDALLDYRRNGVDLSEVIPHADITLIPGGHMLPVTVPRTTADWIGTRA
jgi:hypothetical protein